jgi:hypothetical protein
MSQSPTAAEARTAATGGTTLNSTVRENGVEPTGEIFPGTIRDASQNNSGVS